MRHIYTYQVIRYFPHVLSDEFINVGVMLTSPKEMHRILTEDEAKYLYCSALIGEKKKFLGVVELLNTLASDNRLMEETHYFHNFRFSEKRKSASEKTDQQILEEIFEDYVGAKIQTQEKIDKKALILEQSIQLAESRLFRNFVRVCTDNTTTFDFEIESVAKHIVHHSNIGKTTRKDDVTRMVMAAPEYKDPHNRYDFLNMNGKVDPENPYVKKLEHNFVDPYPYKTEEQMASYLEQIAS